MSREKTRKFRIRAAAIAGAALAMLLAGCGQIVSERLAVSATTPAPTCPTGKKIVVLPLADYSYAEDTETAVKRNLLIMENITDQLTANGFRMPVEEDLLKYLASKNIIRLSTVKPDRRDSTRYLQGELGNDWSSAMMEEISSIIAAEKGRNNSAAGAITALDNETLAAIANDLKADIIMRGRIVKYALETENSWRPLKRGILPVIIGGTNRLLFGVTNSETYDTLNDMAVGGAIGAPIGSNTDATTSTSTYSAAGAAVGYLTAQGGKANQATVQLRLWVQNPANGEVIWNNRVEVKVRPRTIFANTDPDALFNTAIRKAVGALVDDFVAKTRDII